jgi:hypothetical protein
MTTTTLPFDSHAILVKHYIREIREWNWQQVLTTAESNVERNEWGEKYGRAWLGTIFGLSPSGKIYAPWTTNQTRSNVRRDEAFFEALDTVAEMKDGFISWEDDNCFFTLPSLDCARTPEDEMDDAASFDINE